MAISGVNFGAVAENPSQVKPKRKDLGVKTVATATAVPVAVGLGYATRFYYENKGKASVYKDLVAKFPADDAFKSCLSLTEKSQRNSKIGAVALVVAGAATVLAYAGAKMFGAFDKAISKTPKQDVKSVEQPKIEQKAEAEVVKEK